MLDNKPLIVPVSGVPTRAPKTIETRSETESDFAAYLSKHQGALKMGLGDILYVRVRNAKDVFYVTTEGYIRKMPRLHNHASHIMPQMIKPFIDTEFFNDAFKLYDEFLIVNDATEFDRGKIIKNIKHHKTENNMFEITYYEMWNGKIKEVRNKNYRAEPGEFEGYLPGQRSSSSSPASREKVNPPRDVLKNGNTVVQLLVSAVPNRPPKEFKISSHNLRYIRHFLEMHKDIRPDVGDIIAIRNGLSAKGTYYVTQEGYIRKIPRNQYNHVTHIMPHMIEPFELTKHLTDALNFYDIFLKKHVADLLGYGKIIKDILENKQNSFNITYYTVQSGKFVTKTEENYTPEDGEFDGYFHLQTSRTSVPSYKLRSAKNLPKDILLLGDKPLVVKVSKVPKRAPKVVYPTKVGFSVEPTTSAKEYVLEEDNPLYILKHNASKEDSTFKLDVGDLIDMNNSERAHSLFYVTTEGYIRRFPRNHSAHATNIMPEMIRPFEKKPFFMKTIATYQAFLDKRDLASMGYGKIIKEIRLNTEDRRRPKRATLICYEIQNGNVKEVVEEDYKVDDSMPDYM